MRRVLSFVEAICLYLLSGPSTCTAVIILPERLFFEAFYPLKYLLFFKPQEAVYLEARDLPEFSPLVVDGGRLGLDERADFFDTEKFHSLRPAPFQNLERF